MDNLPILDDYDEKLMIELHVPFRYIKESKETFFLI